MSLTFKTRRFVSGPHCLNIMASKQIKLLSFCFGLVVISSGLVYFGFCCYFVLFLVVKSRQILILFAHNFLKDSSHFDRKI